MFPHRNSPRTVAAAVLLAAFTVLGTATPASAATTCSGNCPVGIIVTTPVGTATVTVTAANVVTVALAPTARTLVFGVPFSYPPVLCAQFCTRTTIPTAGGAINIDSVVYPPGPPTRFAFPNVAVISIHPPNPCRAQTIGANVTFTPIT